MGRASGGLPTRLATRGELGDQAIGAAEHLLLSDAQVLADDRASSSDGVALARCPDDHTIHWTPLRSLVTGRTRYLPTACCYYGAPPERGIRPWHADSNGTAAASTEEEAILRGLLELIERDAVAIWWYNSLSRPRVRLGSLPADVTGPVASALESLGWRISLFDLTHDLQVPVCGAVATRDDAGRDPIAGFGAHWDPVRAAAAAPERGRTGRGRPPLRSRLPPSVHSAPLTPPSACASSRRIPAGPPVAGVRPGSREALQTILDGLARRGLDVLVLDQTQPQTGLRVVRVVAPGLRHFWPAFRARPALFGAGCPGVASAAAAGTRPQRGALLV